MWAIYDYLGSRGNSVVHEWVKDKKLEKKRLVRLDQKIDTLAKSGDLAPKLLEGTKFPNIKRIKTGGRLHLRLYLCRGPFDKDNEFTILFGAVKRGNKLEPRNAEGQAENNRKELIKNPLRRREHESLGEEA